METAQDINRTKRINDEAAHWLAAMNAAGLDRDAEGIDVFKKRNADFARWIGADDRHRVVFLRLRAAWSRADRLAALKAPAPINYSPGPQRWAPLSWGAIAAGVTAVALIASLPLLTSRFGAPAPDVFETAIGGRETVPLADGSQMELNTATRLTARFTETERAIILETGEAYFDVTSDPDRPFTVEAGGKSITVLGTRFTVRQTAGDVEVIVEEGRVRVGGAGGRAQSEAAIIETGTVLLAQAGGMIIREKTAMELQAELGWRRGLLIFERQDLASVAEEFNRYNRVKLVIDDARAGDIRIGGSFEADNVEAFSRLLSASFGLNVRRQGDQIFIKS